MKTYAFLCIAAAILVAANASASELPELLIPVTGQEEQHVREQQDYFLKKHTYFAKRHRIVRINTDVLFNAPAFRIALFDDASVIVRRERLDYNGEGSMFTWTGHMENQPISLEEFVRASDLPDVARDFYSDLIRVSISGAKNVYDPKTGRSASLAFIDAKTSRPTASVDSSKGQYEFYSVVTEVSPLSSPLSLSAKFILEPLEIDRRYHILYEEDPTKRISPGEIFRDGYPDNVTDMRYRRLQYEQFLEFLGPDPRSVTNPEE